MAVHEHRVLIFDVVGTLIDFEAGILNHLRPIAARSGTPHGDAALLAAFGRAEDVQQRPTPELPFTQMLEPIHRRLAKQLGLTTPDAEATGLAESVPEWPPFTDSVDALRRLGTRFRLVALTNSDNWAVRCMAQTLGEPFHDKVTVEDVGTNKPAPQMFAYCLGPQSTHGYRKKEVMHVAQSQYHDIAAAVGLGYTTCWIERRHGNEGSGQRPRPAR